MAGPKKNPLGEDLYAQIAAADQAPVVKKPQRSLIMALMIDLMRLTLFWDQKRREHAAFFHVLGIIWAIFMCLLYLAGLTMVGVFVYSYMQFPNYVRAYFESKQISFSELNVPNYTFSEIELTNLEDKNKTFKIGKVLIYSTFSNLLQGRVKSVTLSDVSFSMKENKEGIVLGALPEHIFSLSNPQGKNSIRVDSVSVSNASFNIAGREMDIPISFSLTGVYGNESKLSIPFSIQNDIGHISGTLLIVNRGNRQTWDADMTSVNLKLPQRPNQVGSGKLSIVTDNMAVTSVRGNLELLQGHLKENWELSAQKNKSGFNGKFSYRADDGDPTESKSEMTVEFKNLLFTDGRTFTTSAPLALSYSTRLSREKAVRDLKTYMTGKLTCTLFDKCRYDLTESARVSIQSLRLPWLGRAIVSQDTLNFNLMPKQTKFEYFFSDDAMAFTTALSGVSFNAVDRYTADKISFSANRLLFEGKVGVYNTDNHLKVELKKFRYTTPTREIKDADLTDTNIYDPMARLTFSSPSVHFKNLTVLKRSFGSTLTLDKGQLNGQLDLVPNQLVLHIAGQLDPRTEIFTGTLRIPTFDVAKLPTPLFQFSGLFPEELKNLSGKMAAEGTIVWAGEKQLTGAVDVAFKNLSFENADTSVKNAHAVIRLNKLLPLETAATEDVFIEQLTNVFPFRGTEMRLKIDANFVHLGSLKSYIGNVPLKAEGIVLPFKGVSTLIYLTNNDVLLNGETANFDLPGWQIDELKGSLSLPIEIRDMRLYPKTLEARLSTGTLTPSGSKAFDFMKNAAKLLLRSGTILISSIQKSDLVEVSYSVEGRPVGSSERQVFSDKVIYRWASLFKDLSPLPVPPEIIEKQNRIMKEQ